MKLRLLPREDRFCALLEQLARCAHDCAHHLQAYVAAPDAQAEDIARAGIAAARAESKKASVAVTAELCRSFITPFDREDIQNFATGLYKIPKTITKIVERLEMNGLSASRSDFARQIAVIVQEAEATQDMVRSLTTDRNGRHIAEKAALLQELEQRGDVILKELLQSLFSDERDPRDMILRKDIYDMLEKVVDRYRDAASVAVQIVLKHS